MTKYDIHFNQNCFNMMSDTYNSNVISHPKIKEPTYARYIESRDKLFKHAGINPQSKMVSTGGMVKNIHFLEMGHGEPMIIIHGGLSHSSEWIHILKPLAEKFHLYVLDRPGHGLTDPIDYSRIDFRQSAVGFVKSFMDSMGIDRAHFLANSMGGILQHLLWFRIP